MKTSKILKRFASVEMIAVTDTGEIIRLKMEQADLLEAPGIDSIQTINTVIGGSFGNMLETWAKHYPVETEMQRALAARTHEFSKYVSAEREDDRYFVELFNRASEKYRRDKFYYENYDDAIDDLQYCRKKYESD